MRLSGGLCVSRRASRRPFVVVRMSADGHSVCPYFAFCSLDQVLQEATPSGGLVSQRRDGALSKPGGRRSIARLDFRSADS